MNLIIAIVTKSLFSKRAPALFRIIALYVTAGGVALQISFSSLGTASKKSISQVERGNHTARCLQQVSKSILMWSCAKD
jgi:hypothetical protein